MIRVLLVEDDPVIRDTTCYFLKSQQNFEVVCAETGGDALSHAREKFDLPAATGRSSGRIWLPAVRC